ncbi:hypothetical protein [Oceanobacillus jordanicus]|uniref:DUF4352 domain-containing protein n=1 Tax=Oceanobacillus jordanicus TaxID=2867266 RepID=A0AAW5BBN9_9BACI|nr:hypothetical protein [Oceanobacillus jordanicus]MCG3421108.1 hypothetical protein [Oceanobacillus jordanicus]
MYKSFVAIGIMATITLVGCDLNQQENIKEVSMAELSQQEELKKEEIVLDKDEVSDKAESASSDYENKDQNAKEKAENTERASEPETEEPGPEAEEETKSEEESKSETAPEETEAEGAVATEKETEKPADTFNHYPRGQFAVDGNPGQIVENATGVFTIEKATEAGNVKVGPINIEIKNVSLVSGEVTEESIAGISGDEVSFLQVDAVLQNTSDLPLQFCFACTTMDMNGHQLTAHDMFSGRTDGDYTSTTPKNATLVYMLNEDHPPSEQISNVTIDITSSPENIETEKSVGTGKSIDVSL